MTFHSSEIYRITVTDDIFRIAYLQGKKIHTQNIAIDTSVEELAKQMVNGVNNKTIHMLNVLECFDFEFCLAINDIVKKDFILGLFKTVPEQRLTYIKKFIPSE